MHAEIRLEKTFDTRSSLPSPLQFRYHEYLASDSFGYVIDALRLHNCNDLAAEVCTYAKEIVDNATSEDWEESIYGDKIRKMTSIQARLFLLRLPNAVGSSITSLPFFDKFQVGNRVLSLFSSQLDAETRFSEGQEARLNEFLGRTQSIATSYAILGELFLIACQKSDTLNSPHHHWFLSALVEISRRYELFSKNLKNVFAPLHKEGAQIAPIIEDYRVYSGKTSPEGPQIIFADGTDEGATTGSAEGKEDARDTQASVVDSEVEDFLKGIVLRSTFDEEHHLFHNPWDKSRLDRESRVLQNLSRIIPQAAFVPSEWKDKGQELNTALWIGGKKQDQTLVLFLRDGGVSKKKDVKTATTSRASSATEKSNVLILLKFPWAVRKYLARRMHFFCSNKGDRAKEIVTQLLRSFPVDQQESHEKIEEIMREKLVEDQDLALQVAKLFEVDDRPCKAIIGDKKLCQWLAIAGTQALSKKDSAEVV
ncbi:MAG: hypothetical protein SGCHY_000491 [Lobulomycetales sp.]